MIVAGEASGDEHGAALLRELREMQPDVQVVGLGGDALIAEGLDSVGHASDIAVVGLVEALAVVPTARKLFRRLLASVDKDRPRVAVLIDSPEFNLRLAKALDRRGVRVLYYISPQLWAWREGRIETIRRHIERVLVLFEFEAEWYRQRSVKAVHTGHPLVDAVPRLNNVWERETGAPDEFQIALLPGSRRSEVRRLLPDLVAAAKRIAERVPARFLLIAAPNLDHQRMARRFAEEALEVKVVREDRYREIADSHLALCASGTAALEVGLLGVPQVVVYRVHLISSWLGRWVLKLPYVSLVNLVLQEKVVPEMLQQNSRAKPVADLALEILNDRSRVDAMRRKLEDLWVALGSQGASRRAAKEVSAALNRV